MKKYSSENVGPKSDKKMRVPLRVLCAEDSEYDELIKFYST